MVEKETLRRDRNLLVEALKEAGAQFRGSSACLCPFHEDRSASGSVHVDATGVWRFTCHGCKWGGDLFDVQARKGGKSIEDLLREVRRSLPRECKPFTMPAEVRCRPAQRFDTPAELAAAVARIDVVAAVETYYSYTNPDTSRVEMIVVRAIGTDGKKTFRQGRATKDGKGFEWGGPSGLWPLYNRTRIKAAHTVIVVEGEKCVHAITPFLPQGYAATTNPGGAGERKASRCDWSPLAGKRVLVWPDNDPPDPLRKMARQGIDHMSQVCGELEKLSPKPSVTWLNPEDLGLNEKEDAVDYLASFGGGEVEKSRDALLCAFKLGQPVSASRSLHQHLLDTIAGKTLPLKLKWKQLHRLTKLAMPGTITLVCGDPGSTKSYFVLEQFWSWHQEGVLVALYELEEDEPYWLNRALAQVDGNSKLDDREWVNKNGPLALDAYRRHQQFFDSFTPRLFTAPGTREKPQVTQDDLVKWARDQAQKGCRVIGIDPVSMAAPAAGTERSFTPDLKFLVELKLIAREFACSIILVTHPKESLGARKSPIDNLAGGKAYARFAQTIIWACRYDQPKDVRVNIGADREEMASVERYIQNVKTRNGRGAGLDIAFAFDPGTLRFTELGTICRAAANGSNRITQLETQDPFGDPAWVNGEGASENSPLADHLGARLRAPIAQQHIWFDDDKDPGDN